MDPFRTILSVKFESVEEAKLRFLRSRSSMIGFLCVHFAAFIAPNQRSDGDEECDTYQA